MDDRKELFASNIAMGMNQTTAARAAGYNAQQGSGLMQDDEVRSHIAHETRRIQGQLIISRNDVITGMMEAIGDAKLLGEPMPQIAGWREIGKIVGVYAPEERKITLEKDVTIIERRVKELSDEKLHEYALIEGEVITEESMNGTDG